MTFTTCELLTDADHQDGFTYKVIIETSMRGLARLNIECLRLDSDDVENSQGVDMNPTECRALAKMLLATAMVVETN